jgi:hypothetical protein
MSILMRRCLCLLLCGLLVIPLAVLAQEDLTETYISADGTVEFRYPAGWVLDDEDLSPAIILGNTASIVEGSDMPQAGEVLMLLIPVVTEYPFFPFIAPDATVVDAAEALLNDFAGDFQDDAGEFALTEPVEMQVGPYDAAYAEAYDFTEGLGVLILVLDGGDYLMTVVAIAGVDDLPAIEPTVLAIAETFVFSGEITPAEIGEAGPIKYGQMISAELQASQDRWTFFGEAGDVVTIAMNSTDFDAYLELYGPDEAELTRDDDSGGNLNALIGAFPLPVDGTYTIVARSFSSSAEGAYTLELSLFDTGELGEPGEIAYGDLVSVMLSDSTGDRWTFAGVAGDVVTIAMNSDDFDAYLELYGPDEAELARDDDSGGSLNALITGFTLPATGDYTIVARPFSSGSGVYTLELTQIDPAELASVGTLEPGIVVHSALSTPLGERWNYEGAAGERISVLVGSQSDVYLELYDESGALIASTQDTYTYGFAILDDFELPAAGEYTVAVRPRYSDAFIDYTLILGRPAE